MNPMKSLLVAIILCFSYGSAIAKTIADRSLEFSMTVPDQSKMEIVENEKGRSVTAVYQDPATHEAITVQAVRANNGGFNTTLSSFFVGMMDGASRTIGKQPSVIRTLRYLGHELHVAQHVGVGANGSQTLITVAFLQERGGWRKVITVQFIANGASIRNDDYILDRLKAAQFRPVA
jgi:hypothetical protein